MMQQAIGFIGFGEAGSRIAEGLREAGRIGQQRLDLLPDSPRSA